MFLHETSGECFFEFLHLVNEASQLAVGSATDIGFGDVVAVANDHRHFGFDLVGGFIGDGVRLEHAVVVGEVDLFEEAVGVALLKDWISWNG